MGYRKTNSRMPRGALVANREDRRKHETECFGIYRPTLKESKAKLGTFATESSDTITNMLARERDRFAILRPRVDFAVTIVEYGNVKKRLADAVISGFEIGRLVDELSDETLLSPLDLQIKETQWLQVIKKRKDAKVLALRFQEDDN